MNCKTCGTPLEDGAAFCINCGAKADIHPEAEQTVFVNQNSAPAQPVYAPAPAPYGAPYNGYDPAPKKSKAKLFVILGIVLLLIAAVVVTLVLVLGGDDDDKDSESAADMDTETSYEELGSGDPFNSAVGVVPPNFGVDDTSVGGTESAVPDYSEPSDSSAVSIPSVESNPNIPYGYTEYTNDYISFAYPSDWTLTEGSVVMATNSASSMNIVLTYEPASDFYSTLTNEGFAEYLMPMLENQGATIYDYEVEHLVNANDEDVTVIYIYDAYYGVEMYQTMMIVTSGNTCQVVTVSEKEDSGDLLQNVFDSIMVLE